MKNIWHPPSTNFLWETSHYGLVWTVLKWFGINSHNQWYCWYRIKWVYFSNLCTAELHIRTFLSSALTISRIPAVCLNSYVLLLAEIYSIPLNALPTQNSTLGEVSNIKLEKPKDRIAVNWSELILSQGYCISSHWIISAFSFFLLS